MPRLIVFSLLLVAVAAGLVFFLIWGEGPGGSPATYVDRARCVTCHTDQHAAWKGSHHDVGMDHATEKTVRGDFGNATFEHHGVTTRFFRRDGRFYAHTEGPDGVLRDYEVLYTMGYEPLQQYLIDIGAGRLQCLQVSWDTEKKRWYHIQPDRIAPDDPLHWTGLQFNANFMCIECHVTGYDRAFVPETGGYASTWHDIDVGCQACHGPGSNHVAWAESGAGDDASKGLDILFKGTSSTTQVDSCARCHSRRIHVSGEHGHGEPLLDHMAARLLVEPLYHADGQILDEVYVYGSFLQSKKYHKGVRCTDCHDAHSARLKHEGNQMCVQCHQQLPPERFPTIRRAKYDTPAHHFHAEGGPGSQCVDCHAPETTYMGVDPRRDHSFRVPRPDLTIEIGTPNACNRCHEDKSPAWALKEIADRFPLFVSGRVAGGHYGRVFAAARAANPQSFRPLAALALEQAEPAIVRATAVYYLQRFEASEAVRAIAPTLVDTDGLVRATACEAIGRLVPTEAPAGLQQQKVHVLEPLLRDPLRHVRAEAARALAGAAESQIPTALKPTFEAALAEWIATQNALTDLPGPHLNLGALHEARGDLSGAEREYRRAVELDPLFAPARFNLSTLLAGRGQLTEATQVLRAVVEHAPQNGEGWYSLGLLRAEAKDMPGAAKALARAVRLMPTRSRVRYNYALALQGIGDAERSLAELQRAHAGDREDVGILHALIMLHATREEWPEVDMLTQRLQRLRPDDPGVQEAVRRLKAMRKNQGR